MLSNPHLLQEDVSKSAAHHENHKKKEHQHIVPEQGDHDLTCRFNDLEVDGDGDLLREQEALDLLHGGEASEEGEEDHGGGGDEDDVGGVHVQAVPQQLLQERLVCHRPNAEC